MTREVRELAAAAERRGWRVIRLRSGHVQFCPPTGPLIVASGTASDHRAIRNLRAHLRRAGLMVP